MYTDQLLTIISALTTHNKKTLSLYVKHNYKRSLPNYIELYYIYVKLLDKHTNEEEIEGALQKQLKRKPYLSKHINNNRRLLKERLFSILLTCEKEGNVELEIEDSIRIIKVLVKRQLFELAQQKIEQVKEQVKAYDLSNKMIDLIKLELLLISKHSGKNDLIRQTELAKKLEWNLKAYKKEVQFESFFRRMSLIALQGSMSLKEENKVPIRETYERYKIAQFPVKIFEKEHKIHLVYWYYRIQNLYCRLIGTPKKAIQFSHALVQYFEYNIKFKENFESLYLKSICSFTRACKVNGNFTALEESLEKVQHIYESKANLDALEVSCDMGVLHYLNLKQYEKAIEFADLMEMEWKKITSHSSLTKQLWYCYSNLLLFWITNNKPKFEYWLDNGLDIPRFYKGVRIYFAFRMMALIADFDENELFAFKEKIEALQKTLQNNKVLTSFEKTVLSHLRTFYNIEFSNKNINLNQTEKDSLILQNFLSLKKELQALKSPPFNQKEILLWCESHLQNKTIKEVFEAEY